MKLLLLLGLISCGTLDKEYCRSLGYKKAIHEVFNKEMTADARSFRRTGILTTPLSRREWWTIDSEDGSRFVVVITNKHTFGRCR